MIALGPSPEILAGARRNLAARHNVEWVLGSGSDLGMLGDGSVEPVFSYISLQHVPRREDVLSYLEESGRVLRQDEEGCRSAARGGRRPRSTPEVSSSGRWRVAPPWRRSGAGRGSPRRNSLRRRGGTGDGSTSSRVGSATCGW